MPDLLEEVEIHLDRADLLARVPIERRTLHRSPGVHLSGVLRYIAERIGKLDAMKELDEDAVPIRWALGHAWEEFCVSLYPCCLWQPGEQERNGVICSADGWSRLPEGEALEEWKHTAKKIRTGKGFLDEWLWMQQGRGECALWEPIVVRLVRWHICYYMGDYRGSGPVYMRYLVRFTDEEVESTWKMIEAHKGFAVEETGQ